MKKQKYLKWEKFEEDMANVGKWLAYIIFAMLGVFLVIIFSKPDFLQQFITWTLGIVGIIAGGAIIYIIIKSKK